MAKGPLVHYEARPAGKFAGFDICIVNEAKVAFDEVGSLWPKNQAAMDRLIACANIGLNQEQLTDSENRPADG